MRNTPTAPTAIRLLLLSGSLDATEQITTSLRNGGLAVHSTRLSDMDRLEETLRNTPVDLVLCCAYERQIDLRRTLDALIDLECDFPLLVMSDASADPTELLQAMREGAKDLIDKDDLEHLQLVVAREFRELQNRRELATLQQRLRESEQRSLGLIESSREPIAFMQDGMHVHVNQAYLDLFGFENRSDVEDLPLLDMIEKSRHKECRRALKKLEAEGRDGACTVDTTCRHCSGSGFEASLHISKASMDGEHCLQVIIRDKNQNAREIEKKLKRLSRLDSATRLPNRQYFLSQLERWVDPEPASQGHSALVYIALDDTPRLRTILGVEGSDELITGIAGLLRETLEPQDLLARFAETTFTLLCRRDSEEQIDQLSERLRRAVTTVSLGSDESTLVPTCSVGVAMLSRAHSEGHHLISQAYNACETAREQGGDRVVLLRPGPEETQEVALPRDNKILQLIDDALASDRFRLVYQPIVSLQGDTRENYAVLVRMIDPSGEELLPEFFMQQAEQSGKMVEIDRWIIRNAIAALGRQRREGRKITFFVSLAAGSLRDKNLLLWVCDCLREFDARGGWLTFQIREQLARANLQDTIRLIEGLKKIKCQIAIDHFGLLENPESILDQLQIDFAKLAPSLVREVNKNQEKQDELSALNALVLKHGVKTVATGVEDANSLTVLWTVGVSYIQGYFLQEPSESIEYGVNQLM